MSSLTELVITASEGIARKCRHGGSLEQVIDTLESKDSPRAAAEKADQLLEKREQELRSALAELETLRSRVVLAAQHLPFTAEGWLEERRSLEGRFADDLEAGLAAWLDDWYRAVACGQIPALRRLTDEIDLPDELAVIRERCAGATDVLGEEGSSPIVDPVLAVGAGDLELGGRRLLPDEVRVALQLARARLALADDRPDNAAVILDEEALDPIPEAALRARVHALRDERANATRCLEEARGGDPANFDVAIAAIESDLLEPEPNAARLAAKAALDAARLAVDAPATLSDVDQELAMQLGTAPAEMHVAVAERALREGDLDHCEQSLAEAEGAAAELVRATTAQIQAALAERRKAPADEQAEARVLAGVRWMWAEEPERARPMLELAVELTPADPEALLSLADCLMVLAAGKPFAAAVSLAEEALSLVQRASGQRLSDTLSWGHLVEAQAHALLAEAIGPERCDHLWSAFAASCRAVAGAPDDAASWDQLGNAAESLELAKASILFANQALRLEPGPDRTAVLTRVLANTGRLREALQTLGKDNDPWSQAIRAFLRLRTRRWPQAVRLLRTTKLDPNWIWARHALAVGLLLTDRYDEAVKEAETAFEQLSRSFDRFQARLDAASFALLLGRLSDAEELVEPLRKTDERDPDVAGILGMAGLLRGEEEAGHEKLVESMSQARWVSSLEEWRTVNKPVLHALAANHGVSLPSLSEVDEAARARRRELNRLATPAAELHHAGRSREQVDAVAAPLGKALIEMAEGELDAAKATLEIALAEQADNSDLEALLAEVRARHVAATRGEAEDATAADVGETEPEQLLRLGIPGSWVKSDSNPVATHPIFLRYMPAMRHRLGWPVPPVHVYTDDKLEPGGYQVTLAGEVVAEGAVDPASDYVPVASLELISADLRDAAIPDEGGWVRVPHQTMAEADGIAELLSVRPYERAVWRLGEVVSAYADQLRGPVSSSSSLASL